MKHIRKLSDGIKAPTIHHSASGNSTSASPQVAAIQHRLKSASLGDDSVPLASGNGDDGGGLSRDLSINSEGGSHHHHGHHFPHLHLPSSSTTHVYQRKTVLVQAHDGKKVTPTKPSFRKVKIIDGSKEIHACRELGTTELDVSSAGLMRLSPCIGSLHHLTKLFIYKNKLIDLPPEFGKLCCLQQLWLQENLISHLPDELDQCQQLTHLNIRHNRLEGTLPPVITRLRSLKQLLLTYNKLTDIRGIGKLTHLQTLVVNANKLQGVVPTEIGLLKHLAMLNLSHNKLSDLPTEIGNCSALTHIVLDYNCLSSLPDSIGQLEDLNVLGIKYNQLTSIPRTLASCKEMKELNIENNQVTSLPEELLSTLPHVTTVVLSRNNFSVFPPGGPKQFANTEKLSLDHNNIECVPMGIFSQAESLTFINLFYNNIVSFIPEDMSSWTSVVELYLGSNQLSVLPDEIKFMVNLEILEVSNNKLKKLPAGIGTLSKLRNIDFEFNQVECLPVELGQLQQLRVLNGSSNKITELPRTIANMAQLRILKLNDNNIRKLPSDVVRCTDLSEIYLKDNLNLHSLPIELGSLPKLQILGIENCPLSDIPSPFVAGGASGVIQYFRLILANLQNEEFRQQLSQGEVTNVQLDPSLTRHQHSKRSPEAGEADRGQIGRRRPKSPGKSTSAKQTTSRG